MKQEPRADFLAARARFLATVVLSRRADLIVSSPPWDYKGADLLVEVCDSSKPGLRRFGVVVRGKVRPANEEQLAKALKSALREVGPLKQTAFPICLFCFTMQDIRGYFTWILEPVITEEGSPKLVPPSSPILVPLDKKVLDEIAQRVRDWYEALFAALKV
ncbi:MAG: hypothetical protein L0Z62_02910 [Gemmataceae bacterium]|nr:hypothetical protein [Gemmataceae bacterium]